jgi:phospholipase/lecithinase/hemolysin
MYIFTRGIVLILYFLSATVPSLPFPFSLFEDVRFQNIVIIGDSGSDNGNVYALTNETYPIPPYWHGRYSNGPNWVDQLGVLGVSDYAYGSATTDNNLVQGYAKGNTVPVPGMLQQVQLYLDNTSVSNIDFARTLYILWGGGNDFIFNINLTPEVIAASLFKSVQALLDIGAKNILVFNQMPVQYFPFTKPFESPELFTYITDQGNFYISNFTESMQLDNPQASLNIFDIYSLVLNVVTQNSTNFTNTVDNCWSNLNATTVVQHCSNPEEYFFVDTLHFTTRAHGLIADAIRPFLFDSYQVNTSTSFAISHGQANKKIHFISLFSSSLLLSFYFVFSLSTSHIHS